jgi:hypothetical protein
VSHLLLPNADAMLSLYHSVLPLYCIRRGTHLCIYTSCVMSCSWYSLELFDKMFQVGDHKSVSTHCNRVFVSPVTLRALLIAHLGCTGQGVDSLQCWCHQHSHITYESSTWTGHSPLTHRGRCSLLENVAACDIRSAAWHQQLQPCDSRPACLCNAVAADTASSHTHRL